MIRGRERVSTLISTWLPSRGLAGNDIYVQTLLHMNGADASTTFTDSALGGGRVWTAYGGAQIDTAQFKFGGAGGLFDGTGDYISTPSGIAYENLDFTVDFWLKKNLDNVTQQLFGVANSTAAGSSRCLDASIKDTNVVQMLVSHDGNNPVYFETATTITGTAWHHLAFMRYGAELAIYIDGTKDANTANIGTYTLNTPANALSIGRLGEYDTDYFNGWIDEVRMSKNIARWTANFSPPTTEYVT